MVSTAIAKELSDYFQMDNILKVEVRIGPWQLPDSSVVFFTRRDTWEHIKTVNRNRGKEPRPALVEMASSAMYIHEKQRRIIQGDLSIAFHECEERMKQLMEVGFSIKKVHKHEDIDWGNVCHIHVDCDLKGTLKMIKVAQVLSS